VTPLDAKPARAAITWQTCKTRRDRLAAFAVRSIVFIDEQECPFDEEFDEQDNPDSTAIHIVGYAKDEPVGAARIRCLPDVAKLERLSIRKAWRGGGVGHELAAFMLKVASDAGYQRYKLNAQAHLIGFYKKHGFVAQGPIFVEAGIDHRMMVRNQPVEPE
jgi:predicted GNAT family N-acyltransferase